MATRKPPNGPKKGEPRHDGGVELLERTRTKKPRRFKVLMFNDDYTTQEFVVHVLQKFFKKQGADAHRIMLAVHTKGMAVVAVYTKDIAESKVAIVSDYARENGMPLKLSSEPE